MPLQEPDHVLHDGNVADGHQGLGEMGGQGPQARSEPSGHHDCLHELISKGMEGASDTPPILPKYSGNARKPELTRSGSDPGPRDRAGAGRSAEPSRRGILRGARTRLSLPRQPPSTES